MKEIFFKGPGSAALKPFSKSNPQHIRERAFLPGSVSKTESHARRLQ